MKPSTRATCPQAALFAPQIPSHFRTSSPSNIKNKKIPIPAPSLSPISHLLSSAKQNARAFSLTEVVIAMGVAAIAFTSIIALFPLGLNMSKESYEETQAALLAQTILADFRDNLTGSASNSAATGGGPTSGFLIQVSALNSPINFTTNTPLNYTNICTPPTTNPTTFYIAYNQQSQSDTSNGEMMLRPFTNSTIATDFYNSGTNNAVAIAKITIQYCFAGIFNGSMTNGPARIDIAIETPGSLPTEKRKQHLFTGGVN